MLKNGVLRIDRLQFHAERRRHRLNRRKLANPGGQGGILEDGHRDFKPELYPQKHGQEDQDRVQRDPHDVGSPAPPLLYGLLAHGEILLGVAMQWVPRPRTVSLPPNAWTGPWDKPEFF